MFKVLEMFISWTDEMVQEIKVFTPSPHPELDPGTHMMEGRRKVPSVFSHFHMCTVAHTRAHMCIPTQQMNAIKMVCIVVWVIH